MNPLVQSLREILQDSWDILFSHLVLGSNRRTLEGSFTSRPYFVVTLP